MVLERNGWKLMYHPVFGDRYNALRARARKLKADLPADRFRMHADVKLLAAAKRVITEIVPQDPNRPEFWLEGNLAKFRRVKKFGLPDRYRLFYAFSSTAKTIIYLYINDSSTLRQAGASTDPYEVFAHLVRSGAIGEDFETNLAQWNKAHAEQQGS